MQRIMGQQRKGRKIATGRTAEIFAWEDGYVLKLFWEWMADESVEREARISRLVHAAGLPLPAVGEIVEIEGRTGLIYERIEGVSMLEVFKAKPWNLMRFARLFAELHAGLGAVRIPGLPFQREQLKMRIKEAGHLPSDRKKIVLETLDAMPYSGQLCHGDFHPDNVLMTAQGPVLIDWMNGSSGSSLSDVAKTSLLLRVAAPLPGTSARILIEAARRWFHILYLRRYFQLRPGDRSQLTAWEPIVAAARLGENIDEERDRLLALVE